jgi:hypothetical protein
LILVMLSSLFLGSTCTIIAISSLMMVLICFWTVDMMTYANYLFCVLSRTACIKAIFFTTHPTVTWSTVLFMTINSCANPRETVSWGYL